jgi:hypothetical protein
VTPALRKALKLRQWLALAERIGDSESATRLGLEVADAFDKLDAAEIAEYARGETSRATAARVDYSKPVTADDLSQAMTGSVRAHWLEAALATLTLLCDAGLWPDSCRHQVARRGGKVAGRDRLGYCKNDFSHVAVCWQGAEVSHFEFVCGRHAAVVEKEVRVQAVLELPRHRLALLIGRLIRARLRAELDEGGGDGSEG